MSNKLKPLNPVYDRVFWLAVLIGTAFRVTCSLFVFPGFDEAYYGVYSLHPALGYFDHPPMVALTAGIGHWLTGSFSPLSLRLGGILLFIATCWVTFSATYRLWGRDAARWATIMLQVIPLFSFGVGAFVIPDNALAFFWMVGVYSLIRYQESRELRWILWWGVAAGFAMLSKYHGVLMWFTFGCCILLFAEWRKLLREPKLYIAALISLVIYSPDLYWNYTHHWVSLLYQFGKGAPSGRFSFILFLQGLGGQMAYLLPWIMITLLTTILFFLRKNRPETRWLAWFAIVPVVIFSLAGFFQTVLPHWPLPGYLTGLLLLSGLMAQWKVRKAIRFAGITGAITFVLGLLLAFQSQTGFFKLSPKVDLTLDGQGWDRLASYLEEKGLVNDSTVLITHRWFLSGELEWALGGKGMVTALDPKLANGYNQWMPLSTLSGKHAFFITTSRYTSNPSTEFSKTFSSSILIDSLTTTRSMGVGKTFYLWDCGIVSGK